MTFVGDRLDLDPEGLYALLGVEPGAEQAEIKRGFRTQARRWHTDVNHSDEAAERMRSINSAFARLGDPVRRLEYDKGARSRRIELMASRPTVEFGSHEPGGFRPEHFEIYSDGPMDSLDISANRGTWWKADIEFCGNQGHVLNVVVVAYPLAPGQYVDTITFSASPSSVVVNLTALVPVKSTFSPKDAGTSSASTSSTANQTGPRQSTPSSSDPSDVWSHRFTNFARWGMAGLAAILYYALTGDMHGAIDSWPQWLQQILSATLPLGALGLLSYLGKSTNWFSRGRTALKCTIGVLATIGCLGILVALAAVILALLIIAIILAIIFAIVSI